MNISLSNASPRGAFAPKNHTMSFVLPCKTIFGYDRSAWVRNNWIMIMIFPSTVFAGFLVVRLGGPSWHCRKPTRAVLQSPCTVMQLTRADQLTTRQLTQATQWCKIRKYKVAHDLWLWFILDLNQFELTKKLHHMCMAAWLPRFSEVCLGSWFSVCNLILTQLDELWKTTSFYF